MVLKKKKKPRRDLRVTPPGRQAAGADGRRAWVGAVPVFLFLVCLSAYHLNGDPLLGGDQRGNMLLSINLLKHHSFSITPYHAPEAFVWTLKKPGEKPLYGGFPNWDEDLLKMYEMGWLTPLPKYYLTSTNRQGEYVNTFGIGTALTALPVYALLNLLTDVSTDRTWWWYGGKLTASVLVAGTVVLIFLTMRRFVSPPAAVLGALSFGIGSNAWSVSSQALWQHPGFSFFLALGIWFLLDPESRKHAPLYCGASLGMATLCRSTGAIFAVCVGVYLLVVSRSHLTLQRDNVRRSPVLQAPVLKYALGGLLFAVLFGTYNLYYFGSPFTVAKGLAVTQIAVNKEAPGVWQISLAEGMAGILFSPSRGLFVYSPVFLFGVIGAVLAWRNLKRFGPLLPFQVAALITFGLTAVYFDWWGGWSYGPRLLVDMGVVLALSMIPIMTHVLRKPLVLSLFMVLLLYSAAVQVVGAWSYNMFGWNTLNNADIDRPEHRHRLWSLKDNQIRYHIEHFSEARRYKHKFNAKKLANPAPILVHPPRIPKAP